MTVRAEQTVCVVTVGSLTCVLVVAVWHGW